MTADLALIWPELILTIGGLITLMLGTFVGDRNVGLYQLSSLLTLAAAAAAVVALIGVETTVFSGTLSVDGFGGFAKLLIYAASFICIVIAPRFFNGGMRAEYPTLILFAALGMGIMVSSRDLMTLYVGLELNSLAAYVLASFMRTDERSSEAGLKYFVLGALASGMLLYGVSLIYGYSGSVAFSAVASAVHDHANIGVLFGLVFVLVGLAFKISVVPFHMWTPDVYEGAPTPVTTFFASAPKVAAMAVLVRVMMTAFPGIAHDWREIITFVSIASMALGSFAAIGQSNFKRLMAYSSIGHMGFALVGLAAGTVEGAQSVIVYMSIYVVMTLGTFAGILMMRRNGKAVETIADLAGLARTDPAMAFFLAAMMFSLAGAPPLAGFFAKFYVFAAAIKAGLYGLSVIGVLASAVAAFYYLKIVKLMYFDEPAAAFDGSAPVARIVLAVSALMIILFMFAPSPLTNAAMAAAQSLF
jgi:NADH-quinone oxidoreductase subunit N